jgi:hypothetical protein
MTENEAIARIIDHFDVHHHDNRPHPYLDEAVGMAIKALEEIQKYREIGTVEECRAAVEKQKVKLPDGGRDIDGRDYLICPNCCAIVADGEWTAKFCPDCGQKVDWSDEE